MIRVWTVLRATYEVRVYQWLIVMASLTVMWAAGIYGIARFVSEQRADSEQAAAAVGYLAERASYENARDERARCELSVATRDDLRGVFAAIFDAIADGQPPSPVVTRMQAVLDANYPPRTLAECPPTPFPPTPPPSD